jgi:hypothetical protein
MSGLRPFSTSRIAGMLNGSGPQCVLSFATTRQSPFPLFRCRPSAAALEGSNDTEELMRAIKLLPVLGLVALGLAACKDEKKDTTGTTTPPANTTTAPATPPATPPAAGQTTAPTNPPAANKPAGQ